jgi:uncharacterized membrane protein
MKQSKLFYQLLPFIIMAIPWIYLAIVWNQIPGTIPMHFSLDGTPDRYGSKNEIFFAPSVFTVVGIGIYFMLRNLYRIDPKKKYSATTSSVLSRIAVIVLILVCIISMAITYWAIKGKAEGLPILFCGLGLFLAYIGNLMHSIKPNYFAGIRVPWTLENEDNWRKTHQLASKIWFVGGLVLAILPLVLAFKMFFIVFILGVLLMTLVPVMYSYNLYRSSTRLNK